MKKRIFALALALTAALGMLGCAAVSDSARAEAKSAGAPQSAVVDAIMGSYSCKSFKAGEVSGDILDAILESGRKAPSARNMQPWRFTVIRDVDVAKSMGIGAYKDGCLIIVVSCKTNSGSGLDAAFDCALATQNMYVAAQSLGLGAHLYYSGVEKINQGRKAELGIPEGYDAKIILLVGNAGDGVDAVASASKRNPAADIVNYIG